MADEKMSDRPHDRLTRIGDRLTDLFDADPEYQEGDKLIVFLDDGKRGGIAIHGYEDSTAAMVDLLLHLRAIFNANGKDLDLAFIGDYGVYDTRADPQWRG